MTASSQVKASLANNLAPNQIPEQFLPVVFGFLVLFERVAFLRVPALEAVVFGRGREAKLFLEDLLSFGTEQKIDKQKRRVWTVGSRRQGNTAGVGRIQIHRHPLRRRAFWLPRQHVVAKNRDRHGHLTGRY